jgi:hypothetical protein
VFEGLALNGMSEVVWRVPCWSSHWILNLPSIGGVESTDGAVIVTVAEEPSIVAMT